MLTLLLDFPWCGYLIDMKNLTISVDYTRYKDKGESNGPVLAQSKISSMGK